MFISLYKWRLSSTETEIALTEISTYLKLNLSLTA